MIRTITLCLLFAALALSARAQITSSCTVPADLHNAYKRDVADLAAKRLIDHNSPDRILVGIPAVHTDSIWTALAAILNTGTQIEADSVFRHHCIHIFRRFYAEDSIYIRVDTSVAWTHNWLNGQSASGLPALDALLNRYNISVDSVYRLPVVGYDAQLRIPVPVNYYALKDSLLSFPGILSVDVFAVAGDGNWILYDADSVRRLTFIRGWGDCPAGCTEHITWKYTVSNDCAVSLVQKTETITQGWPTIIGCNLRPLNAAAAPAGQTRIYPNPFEERMVLDVPGGTTFRYSLSDVFGRTVLQGSATGRQSLAAAHLAPGQYVLRLETKDGKTEHKLVVKSR